MPAEIDDVAKIFGSLMRGEIFPKTTDATEQICNELVVEIAKLKEGDSRSKVAAMRKSEVLKTAVIRLVYGTADPNTVPQKYLKHSLAFPIYSQFATPEQRRSVDRPMRGIRVFCMECQGQDYNGVRECAAINCFFWPFRMRENPFFARIVDAEAEVNETNEEIEAMELENINAHPPAHKLD